MKHSYIVANWKMYSLAADAHIIATSLRNELEHLEAVDVILAPPTIWLTELASIIPKHIDHLHLGIQNIFDQDEGPFTGEISPKMAAGVVEYAILGHSERVEHFREGQDFINSKIQAALRNHLKPIVCIGEREKTDKSPEKLLEKLEILLRGLDKKDLDQVLVAYEPVWAIGSGRADSPEDANKMAKTFQAKFGLELKVLYGGSVDENNANAFLYQKNLSGLLVGRASLKIKSFVTICRQAEKVAKGE